MLVCNKEQGQSVTLSRSSSPKFRSNLMSLLGLSFCSLSVLSGVFMMQNMRAIRDCRFYWTASAECRQSLVKKKVIQRMNSPFSKGKAMPCHIHRQLTKRMNSAIRRHMGKKTLLFTPMIALVLSGCVQVQAPDKQIVINLNIQIRQEVLYRLDQASKQVIDNNPGIF